MANFAESTLRIWRSYVDFLRTEDISVVTVSLRLGVSHLMLVYIMFPIRYLTDG